VIDPPAGAEKAPTEIETFGAVALGVVVGGSAVVVVVRVGVVARDVGPEVGARVVEVPTVGEVVRVVGAEVCRCGEPEVACSVEL